MGVKTIEGSFEEHDVNVALVVSRWNEFITERLKDGAIKTLIRHGIPEENITVVNCPGAYEIPLTAQTLLDTGKYDGIVCLGAVIRGSTPHFDYVCNAVNNGISQLNLSSGKPVTFGVLTTDTIDQAIERSGTKAGNKGEEASTALLEMISLINKINQ
jgi:6,7-dimethyl-8-ribityllumazine synthase